MAKNFKNFNSAIRNTPLSKAAKYFGARENIINFSLGEPQFLPPKSVQDAYIQAIREGTNRYAPVQGYPELREALAEKLRKENKIDASAEEIFITNGASEAIFFSILTLVEKGDEVIIFEPNYPIVSPVVKYLGGTPRVIKLKEENAFQIDIEELKNAVNKKTKFVVINTPHNPTGTIAEKETLKAIAEICRCNILVDEVYEKLVYGKSHFSLGSIYGNVLTVNSFSKSYCMCGYRVGYIHAPGDFIQQLMKLKLYSTTCSSAPAQKAALAALKDREFAKELQKKFSERRDIMMNGLRELGIPFIEPGGAFFVFPNISLFGNDGQVYELFLKAGVLIMPGTIFGENFHDYVRFSFTATKKEIEEGIRRLQEIV